MLELAAGPGGAGTTLARASDVRRRLESVLGDELTF
jgi:hypothetical protein